MEAFSKQYHACNPQAIATTDTYHLMAYACIMLHTDAHNPHIKRRMRKREFVKSLNVISKEISVKELEGMYDRITSREIERVGGSFRDTQKALFTIGTVFIKFGRAGKPHYRRVCHSRFVEMHSLNWLMVAGCGG